MRALFHALIAAGVFSTLACMVVVFELSTDIPSAFSEQAGVYVVYDNKKAEDPPVDTEMPFYEDAVIVGEVVEGREADAEKPEVVELPAVNEEEPFLAESHDNENVALTETPVVLEKPTVHESEPVMILEDVLALRIANLIYDVTNAARAEAGLEDYSRDAELEVLATARSKEMVVLNYFSHTSPRGCDMDCVWKSSGYEAIRWGENIAWYDPYTGLTPEELAEKFVHDWEQSSGHRKNLLSSAFTHQGIGIAVDGTKLVVTVIFAEPQ